MQPSPDRQSQSGQQRRDAKFAGGGAHVVAEQAPVEAKGECQDHRQLGEPVERVESEERPKEAQPGLREDSHDERDEEESVTITTRPPPLVAEGSLPPGHNKYTQTKRSHGKVRAV